jgi:hypothetical protein
MQGAISGMGLASQPPQAGIVLGELAVAQRQCRIVYTRDKHTAERGSIATGEVKRRRDLGPAVATSDVLTAFH